MRIDSDVRRCVVFIGHADEGNPDSFRALGTGFFVHYDRTRYLVTAQHVAQAFGDAPVWIRVNRKDGTSDNIHFDPLMEGTFKWLVHHEDHELDLAVLPFQFSEAASGLDMLALSQTLLATDGEIGELGVGVGDLCYAIGLFRVLQGAKRNVPVVHTGTIALMAGDELVPVRDWRNPTSGNRHLVRGYLAEIQNLKGLSGAPVLVRASMETVTSRLARAPAPDIGDFVATRSYDLDVRLLGVWSASWDAPLDPEAVVAHGEEMRAPLGMGTVIPTSKLLELFELPHVVENRNAIWAWVARNRPETIAQNPNAV